MTIKLTAEIEQAVTAEARRLHTTPERWITSVLELHLQNASSRRCPETPEDRIALLSSLPVDCGITLSDEAVSSDGLYD
jgi:hypothetical protein